MRRSKKTPPTNTSPPNPPQATHDPTTAYALAVQTGELLTGPLVRAACDRHLRDLSDGPTRGLFWDAGTALRAIEFFPDVLRLSEGEHAGHPFVLQPWQAFIVGSCFGWKGPDGFRRFRNAYVEAGKGSGKSPVAAGLALYMLVADKEPGAEIYAAATTREQARILFRDAAHMVEASPWLSRYIQKSGLREVLNLAHVASGSFFRPVSSEGRGLDGKRVHFAAIDEIHEHPSDVVVEKMRAGTKGRRQAMIFEITNSGYDRNTICYQHHEYSTRVVTGQIEDDGWFAFICALDENDDPFNDPSCWVKANPNLDISVTRKYIEEQVREAKGMPAKASIVRRLNFCQWVDAANPAIPQELWQLCEVPAEGFDEDALRHLNCMGGLDLSGTRDLTALARVYEPDADGIVHAVVEFWTPGDTLGERSRADRVPYDVWVNQGHVTATPGRAVDYAFVAQRMLELQAEYGLQTIAFDPYRIKYLEAELQELGVELEMLPHGQGYYSSQQSNLWMPRSLDLLEGLIGSGKLRVKANPALTYAAASAVHVADPKGNLIYDKRRSTGRIDGIVALAMGVGAVIGGAIEAPSMYESDEAFGEIAVEPTSRAERTPPRDRDDGGESAVAEAPTWDPAVLRDVRHPAFAENKRRFEAWQAQQPEDY